MTTIPLNKNLEPYFKIARWVADDSPCARRKYGCVIVTEGTSMSDYIARANVRASDCCNGVCQRTRLELFNGERVEVGAEVHAETAALIESGHRERGQHILLVGIMSASQELLRGLGSAPCHTCALNIKYAGFKNIYLYNDNLEITPYSIDEIIKHRELEQIND